MTDFLSLDEAMADESRNELMSFSNVEIPLSPPPSLSRSAPRSLASLSLSPFSEDAPHMCADRECGEREEREERESCEVGERERG